MDELRDIPPPPEVPESQRGSGALHLRYDDVTQHGRMRLEPLTHAVSAALWRHTIPEHPLSPRLAADGILPILARLVLESGSGPISVRGSVQCRGAFELVRTMDERGRVRLRLDAFAEVSGERGRTFGPPPEGAGESIVLGRVIAQHVLTRPFEKDPDRRQVHDLALPEGTTVRDAAWSAPAGVLELPAGASWIDDAFVTDPRPVVFGLGHTDSNQHVNSLVYPRLFEEAALRRFSALVETTSLFARHAELAFRKPCFAGDQKHIVLRAYRRGRELGIAGALVDSAESASTRGPGADAHCFVRMQLTP